MDSKTAKAYLDHATAYSADWLAQPEPSDVYSLVAKFFVPGGKTADIGCGSGRDTNWLAKCGFQVSGFDASAELVKIAREQFPQIAFAQANLPLLAEIALKFENVFCETVIMHLSKDEISESLRNLRRILKKGGVMYLSWRVTEGDDLRDFDGRLYTAFNAEFILGHFDRDSILHFEDAVSVSSGKRVCRLVISRGGA